MKKTRVECVIAAMPMVDVDNRYHIEEWARAIDVLEADGKREIEGLMACAPNALTEDAGLGSPFDGYTNRIKTIREAMRISEEGLRTMLRFAGALKAYVETRKGS